MPERTDEERDVEPLGRPRPRPDQAIQPELADEAGDHDATAGFRMLGDNNRSIDPWTPTPADAVRSAWFVVPGFGRLLALLHQPAALAALAVAVVVVASMRRRGAPFVPPRTVPAAP